MVRTLANKGVEVQTLHWVHNLLTHRKVTAQLGNTKVEKDVNGGPAEGGVMCAPLFDNVGSETQIRSLIDQK